MVYVEDFVITGSMLYTLPIRMFDYKKIERLSDENFSEFYLKLMEEYRDKYGYWSEGKIPHCHECNSEISEPKYLRKYYGRCLDPACFKKVHERERRDEEKSHRKYWDKVAELDLN